MRTMQRLGIARHTEEDGFSQTEEETSGDEAGEVGAGAHLSKQGWSVWSEEEGAGVDEPES